MQHTRRHIVNSYVVVFNRIEGTAVDHPKKKKDNGPFSTPKTSAFFSPTPNLRAGAFFSPTPNLRAGKFV